MDLTARLHAEVDRLIASGVPPWDVLVVQAPKAIGSSYVVEQAFAAHLEDALRREITAEFDAIDAARWEPTRLYLRTLATTRTWTEIEAERAASYERAAQMWAAERTPPTSLPSSAERHDAA